MRTQFAHVDRSGWLFFFLMTVMMALTLPVIPLVMVMEEGGWR